MLIIPAIDIKDGCVVRFTRGRLNKKIYSRDPIKTAKHWQRQGARLIHIVDLDGATSGKPKNLEIVKKIVETIDTPVQFGGGARKRELIRKLFDYGIQRVVISTQAVEDKDFLKMAFKEFRDKIIVSADAEGNRILIKGWQTSSRRLSLLDFAHTLKEIGFKQMIYTDILRDGTLSGPNIKGIKKLLKETGIQIIVSGGVRSLDDIYRIKLLERQGVIGVIIGKALYEGKLTLSQALKMAYR